MEAWLDDLAVFPDLTPVVTEKPGARRALLTVCAAQASILHPLLAAMGGSVRALQPNDWLQRQKRNFVLRVGRQLAVVSESGPAPDGVPVLRIPAGMAFGTGEHTTTALCLRQVAEVIRRRKRSGDSCLRLIDAGTGSGILALAAALLGARVEAFDADPICLKECRANASRHPQVPKVEWRRGDVLTYRPRHQADVVVANLFADLLRAALPRMLRWVRPGGLLIMSGILRTQETDIRNALAHGGYRVTRTLRRGKWVCLVASK
ncbi:MAG: 50S ribosomal protein L11 methyltransferase [Candidatus Methylacidiphilales bacterium]|nr:50S ribosomal protein L11 methyltransferase [Candidatus Methylacidiphilales bacterium]